MTEHSTMFRGLNGPLTLVKIRSHLVRYRYHGESIPPGDQHAHRPSKDEQPKQTVTRVQRELRPVAWKRGRRAGTESVASVIPPDEVAFAVPAGTVLEPGGVYLDLATPGGVPFVALRGQMAGSRNRYVARGRVPVDRWNILVSGGLGRDPRAPAPDPIRTPSDVAGWEDDGGALGRGNTDDSAANRTERRSP